LWWEEVEVALERYLNSLAKVRRFSAPLTGKDIRARVSRR
jgi:hypothetical protein